MTNVQDSWQVRVSRTRTQGNSRQASGKGSAFDMNLTATELMIDGKKANNPENTKHTHRR